VREKILCKARGLSDSIEWSSVRKWLAVNEVLIFRDLDRIFGNGPHQPNQKGGMIAILG
jgi:hypothetical protein